MKLEALIFDVDGTMADTEEAHRIAFNRAFSDAGLDWRWDRELYGKLLAVTGGKERMRYYVEHYRPDFQKPDNFSDYVAELHKNKTQHYTELLKGGNLPLRPGVLRLIQEGRDQGLRLAIATTTSPANIEALLKYSAPKEIADWFDVIADSQAAPVKKPAPDVYDYVLEKLQLAPEQCMAFEDSENGIKAAQAAGLKTIITVNDYTRDQHFDGAAIVLDKMGEPDDPFTVLSDTAMPFSTLAQGSSYLDLALVDQLHHA